MTAIDFKLDYFQIYDVENLTTQYSIRVKGQFDAKALPCDLNYLDQIAIPVSKNQEPAYNPGRRLSIYSLNQRWLEPTRTIYLKNQFGEQKIWTKKAIALMAPVTPLLLNPFRDKVLPQWRTKPLDHFKVYKVVDWGAPVNKEVVLREVGSPFVLGEKEYKVMVTYPVAFAVPVEKTYNRKTTPIINPKAHLVIYALKPMHEIKALKRVISDQFGRKTVKLSVGNLLAVPTEKLKYA